MRVSVPVPPRPLTPRLARAPRARLSRGVHRVALAGLGLLALAGAPGCRGKAQGRGAPPPTPVTVATVASRDVVVRLRAVGTVEPVSTVRVVAQVTGMIQRVHFREGDLVAAGDLLFCIDTRPYASGLAAAQAQVVRDQALARQAREEADRAARLAASELASAQDVSRAQAAAAAAQAALEASEARVRAAALDVQFAQIRAPIAGRTGSLLVVAGNVVKANDTQPLVVIRSLVPIHVRFAVPEEHLPELRRRMQAGVVPVTARPRGAGGQEARGALVFLENTVDPATGTIGLKAEFTNEDHALWPGQFVDVTVELGVERGATVVPDTAIQMGQDGAYAFVVGEDGRARLRSVQVRRTIDAVSVLEAGLRRGERVVTDGQVKRRDGSPVTASSATPERADPPAAASGGASPPAASAPGAAAPAGAGR